MDYFKKEYEFLPWISLSDEEKSEQKVWQEALCEKYDITFGADSVVSKEAHLYSVKGSFGKHTLIGSHALLRSLDITAGDNCSFNTYSVVHGKVTMGDNVRIAPGAKIFGENHGLVTWISQFASSPIHKRALLSKTMYGLVQTLL